ncbi:MAG: hypothetical protein ACHQUC_03710 [Chlamydiales bacterium]
MRATNNLKYAENYLSGFSDVINHETIGKILIGILKIISYISFLPPMYFLYASFENKKIIDLQNSFDTKFDKISEIFTQTIHSEENPEDRQKRLIDYLANKLVNFEETDNIELEKSRFEKGFRQLSFESQKDFFHAVNQSNCLETALKWIPKDITALNFLPGSTNPINHSERNARHVKLFLEELPKFTQLETITLNLRGLGFYSAEVDKSVQIMAMPGTITACLQDKTNGLYQLNGNTYHHYNDNFQVIQVVKDIRALISKQPNLSWRFYFADFGAGGKGTDLTMAADGKPKYLTNFRNYLQKNS